MERLLVTVFISLFITVCLRGQSYDLSQSKAGTLILSDKTELKGNITIGTKWQSVIVGLPDGIRQIEAEDIQQITLENEGTLYKVGQKDGEHFIFETLEDGERPLLISESPVLEKEENPSGYYTIINDKYQAVEFGNDLYKVFGKFRKEMSNYAYTMALEPEKNNRDLVMIFDYFNNYYASRL